MHSIPSSRHLSHDYPAWNGLSLRALFYLVLTATSINTSCFILFGFLLGYPLIIGCLGFLLSFILSITLYPKILSRLKSDKPHGYLYKKMILGLSRVGMMKAPWTFHQGSWGTKRRLGGHNV